MLTRSQLDSLSATPYYKVAEICRKAAADGIIMLKNDGILPLSDGVKTAVFGVAQLSYYKSGTGSGGMVNTSPVPTILDALQAAPSVILDTVVTEWYQDFKKNTPERTDKAWGSRSWSPVDGTPDEEFIKEAANRNEVGLFVLGRTGGEDNDHVPEKGSYYLSDAEDETIRLMCKHFQKTVVVMNTGSVMDMAWTETYKPGAILCIGQGGQAGALAAVDVLTGVVTPSGKLTDTIARNLEDYPSSENFGKEGKIIYAEDIYVGYRYFETFAPENVLYPFGFGLSYTDFDIVYKATVEYPKARISAVVKNIGNFSGREVVQVYLGAPCGKLGRPKTELCGFAKTALLNPGDSETVVIDVDLTEMSAYDDSGVTGHKSSYVLEDGDYTLYAGTDVRSAKSVAVYRHPKTTVTKTVQEAIAPTVAFDRLCATKQNGMYSPEYRPTPLRTVSPYDRQMEHMPKALPITGDRGIKLCDVRAGRAAMSDFIAQLSPEDLCCLARGEGMDSYKVTPGTGAAFGGLTPSLVSYGIPPCCATDGPSGLRMDSGAHATSIPNGTMLASTFDVKLNYELFEALAVELYVYNIDCLLGPGINIHRNPLCGRNFEYFSEDPYLTGYIAAAQAEGLSVYGATATIKHFACNNQETDRHAGDSVVSERALRELYLKAFEICIKNSNVKAIMTSYNLVNGIQTSSHYDLNTTILRDEWGYSGFVMTDWWTNMNVEGGECTNTDLRSMVCAQNDIYMVISDTQMCQSVDNLASSLEDGTLTLGELQRNAANICRFVLSSTTFSRLADGEQPDVRFVDADNLTAVLTFDTTLETAPYEVSLNEGLYVFRVTYTTDPDTSELAQYTSWLVWKDYVRGSLFLALRGTGGKSETTTAYFMTKSDFKSSFTLDIPNEVKVVKVEVLKNL